MKMAVMIAVALVVVLPHFAAAQEPRWTADVSIGYAGFVDEVTDNYFLAAAGVRRHLTERVSVGPEVVVMSNPGELRDLNVLVTGNVMYEFVQPDRTTRVVPFVVGGVGIFRGRDQVMGGPFWFSDPAFTAGGGLRLGITDTLSMAGEYRIGWEPHQRISASLAFGW